MIFGKKKHSSPPPDAADKAGEAGGSAGTTLLLHVGSLGWRARTLGADGRPQGDDLQESLPINKGSEEVLAAALSTLGKGALKEAGRISILLESDDCMFSDAKSERLRAASPAAAREYGQRQLGVDEVTYGEAPFGRPDPDSGQQGRLFAFTPAKPLRQLLARFDQAALKVAGISPVAYPLAARAAERGGVYGALQLGGNSSCVVLANHELGAVVARKIPIGIATLIEGVASNTSLGAKEVLETLGKKDYLREVLPQESAGESRLSDSPYAQALRPALEELRDEIAATLEFFDAHRGCGRPPRLELFGGSELIAGLGEWLKRHLTIPLADAERPLFELFAAAAPQPLALNLLKGEEQGLVTVGKVRYRFTGQGFEPARKAENLAEEESEVSREAPRSRRDRRERRRNRRERGGRRGAGASRREGGGLGKLLEPLRGLMRRGSPAEAPEVDPDDRRNRNYLLATFLLAALVLWAGYDAYEQEKKRYLAQAARYEKALVELDRLRHSGRDDELFVPKGPIQLDKVLWTEKFLSIASNMDESLWLTDVYLTEEQRSIGEAQVKTKKLTMEGAALPSTDGHIARIADYIDKLEADGEHFMGDFREVVFGGAHLDAAEGDPVVRFTLEAWYDANKRVEEEHKRKKKPQEGGIADIQKSQHEREKVLESVTPGMGGGKH